jgi:hypothetical protein
MRIILLAFPLLASCVSLAQVSTGNGNDLARRVVTNELHAETKDQSHWFFLLQTYKPGGTKESDEVVETKDGDVKRPLLINGRSVNPAEANWQVEQMAHDHDGLQKSLKHKNDDAARSQGLLKMLPDAFTFKFGVRRGELVQLKFSPNPDFKPPNREAEVFHAMQGSLWVDSKKLRVEEISGSLMHELKFGGGVLGYLDPGGTFDVKQAEVSSGYWELTLLNVHMKGKALFFKTIAVDQRYARRAFKQVPDTLTVADGIKMLENGRASKQSKAAK